MHTCRANAWSNPTPRQRSRHARADSYVAEALGWLPDASPTIVATDAAAKVGRVLVADDNADLRDYVRRLLSEHHEVGGGGDGLAALQAARTRRPDVIVADVMMPRLDGFGLIQQLRKDLELRTVPVLVLSARAGEEARLEGLHRGADDYLVKPFSARELQVAWPRCGRPTTSGVARWRRCARAAHR